MNHTDPTADAHVAEARRAVHESLILLSAWEADRVRALIADLETAVEGRAAMRAAVPPPADRAAVLREAAERLLALKTPPNYVGVHGLMFSNGVQAAGEELRRLAAEAQQQPDTEAPTEETGAALARYIADQPMSEIQAAIRILGWPSLRFELVEDEDTEPDTGDDHSCAESGCSGEPAPVAPQPEPLRAELKPWQLLTGQPDEPLPQTERVIGGRRLATTEQQPAAADTDGPRTVCVCGHTRAEHIRIGGPFGRGRLLCDACNPDSTDNLTCEEFEAL